MLRSSPLVCSRWSVNGTNLNCFFIVASSKLTTTRRPKILVTSPPNKMMSRYLAAANETEQSAIVDEYKGLCSGDPDLVRQFGIAEEMITNGPVFWVTSNDLSLTAREAFLLVLTPLMSASEI